MKKALVLGSPGAGKSTFSLKLAKLSKLPLYHLDLLYWNKDKTTVSREVLIKRIKAILERDSWIIDGNYLHTMDLRLKEADTIFFLDIPKEECLEGVRKRLGKKRVDMPWIEEELDPEFMDYIKGFDTGPIYDILNKSPDKKIYIFKSHQEADNYINNYSNALL